LSPNAQRLEARVGRLEQRAPPRIRLEWTKLSASFIGAGVIGLAVARRLAQAGPLVILLKRPKVSHRYLGAQQRSDPRGIYYPAGSLDGAEVRQRPKRDAMMLMRGYTAFRIEIAAS